MDAPAPQPALDRLMQVFMHIFEGSEEQQRAKKEERSKKPSRLQALSIQQRFAVVQTGSWRLQRISVAGFRKRVLGYRTSIA
jgi:hypothetical protein